MSIAPTDFVPLEAPRTKNKRLGIAMNALRDSAITSLQNMIKDLINKGIQSNRRIMLLTDISAVSNLAIIVNALRDYVYDTHGQYPIVFDKINVFEQLDRAIKRGDIPVQAILSYVRSSGKYVIKMRSGWKVGGGASVAHAFHINGSLFRSNTETIEIEGSISTFVADLVAYFLEKVSQKSPVIYIHDFSVGCPDFNQRIVEALSNIVYRRKCIYPVIGDLPLPEDIDTVFQSIPKIFNRFFVPQHHTLSMNFISINRFLKSMYGQWIKRVDYGGDLRGLYDPIAFLSNVLNMYITTEKRDVPIIVRAVIDLIPLTGFSMSTWYHLVHYLAKLTYLVYKRKISINVFRIDDYDHDYVLKSVIKESYGALEFERITELAKLVSGCDERVVEDIMQVLRSVAHEQEVSSKIIIMDANDVAEAYGTKAVRVLETLRKLGVLVSCSMYSSRFYIIALPRLFAFKTFDDHQLPEIRLVSLHQGGVALDDVEKLLPRQLRSPATTNYLYEKMAIAKPVKR